MIPARLRLPALVVGALAATATLAACGGTDAATTSPAAAQTGPTATGRVAISGFAFGPASITVKAGTTVTWTQQDEDQHTVTANDGAFGSSPLVTGATYTHTFTTAGTYRYHCSIHPFMHGTVVVGNG